MMLGAFKSAWNELCIIGYSIEAHFDGLLHTVRGHQVHWFGSPRCVEPWAGHLGCIVCDECPDTSLENGKHAGLIIWMRHSNVLWWIAKKVCAFQGHAEFKFCQKYAGHDDANGDPVMIDGDGRYCVRCLADERTHE